MGKLNRLSDHCRNHEPLYGLPYAELNCKKMGFKRFLSGEFFVASAGQAVEIGQQEETG
jgi:hypothetical protein